MSQMVSIIMPVKDAALFLVDCLDSILAQTNDNWELIAVDDHSSDESFEILKAYSKKDHRIIVKSNKGVGIVNALSLAFNNSSGEFIHRMDADDIMPAKKLEVLLGLLDGQKKAIATGNVEYFSNDNVSDGYLSYENWINNIQDYRAEVYRECTIGSPNWIVQRSCFDDDISISELNYPEDYDLVLKWHQLGYSIKKSKSITHLWREHPKRTSRNSDIYQQESFFRLKTKHFLDNEISGKEGIQLIGAGVKGKLLAKILNEQNVHFDWFDVNIGRVQSLVQINSMAELKPNVKTILTAWPKDKYEKEKMTSFINSVGLEKGKTYWLF
ncbi:MAG: glycosyltransferase involved in cell wall biosynthesis [Arenicella sp.]|jgi:glycosyltransferase involved in cell wall biosynthesis